MSFALFQHESLERPQQQIRLLQIHGLTGIDPSEPISCSVHHVDIGSTEKYTALSYAWGLAQPSETINLNGQPFDIRSNLYEFLQQVRDSWPSLADSYFWIDQLCIDQKEPVEKAKQVAIMSTIYAEANSTVVWLGKSLNCVRDHSHDLSTNSARNFLLDWTILCSNDYWSRLWIVQEICFSNSIVVMIGHLSISFQEFIAGFHKVNNSNLLDSVRSQTIQRLIETKMMFAPTISPASGATQYRPQGLPLTVVLHWFAGLECSDVRDQLYGLMSLVRANDKVEVDYTITPEELFMHTAYCARETYPSEHDHASFCLLLLVRLNLEQSEDVEVSLSGIDRCYNATEILQWREQLCQDPSEYKYLITTAGRLSSCVEDDDMSLTDGEDDIQHTLKEIFGFEVPEVIQPGTTENWQRHREKHPHTTLRDSQRRSAELLTRTMSGRITKDALRHSMLKHSTTENTVDHHLPLGCPMVKAEPDRYTTVHGPCTSIKGITPTPKALMEHLKKWHCRTNRCLKCFKWHKSAADLAAHQKHAADVYRCHQCCKRFDNSKFLELHRTGEPCVPGEVTYPELFTEVQEQVFNGMKGRIGGYEGLIAKYRSIFNALWPDHPDRHRIWPYYDFVLFTHLIPGFQITKEVKRAAAGGLRLPPDRYPSP